MGKEIDFIGVGAPRCGTTWIAECLMEHPEISFPYTKELNYFSHTREKSKSEYDISGIKGYLRMFQSCEKKKGEFSTYYMVDEEVAGIIKKYFPTTKIIISIRNPVERAYSDWKNMKFFHLKEKRNFEEAFLQGMENKLDDYKERGLYFKQIKNYLDKFPKKNIKIIIYEDINKNPLEVIKALYEFLEVDSSFIPKKINEKINVSKQLKSNNLKNAFNVLSKIYRKLETSFLGGILVFLKRKTKINELLWKRTKGEEKKEIIERMDEKTRRKILDFYLEDIEKTEKLIGRNLKEWKR